MHLEGTRELQAAAAAIARAQRYSRGDEEARARSELQYLKIWWRLYDALDTDAPLTRDQKDKLIRLLQVDGRPQWVSKKPTNPSTARAQAIEHLTELLRQYRDPLTPEQKIYLHHLIRRPTGRPRTAPTGRHMTPAFSELVERVSACYNDPGTPKLRDAERATLAARVSRMN